MPRIFSTRSPTEVVCGLQAQLATMANGDEEMSFAYAVINASERTLSYARTGRYPQVTVTRAGGNGGEGGAGGSHQMSSPEIESRFVGRRGHNLRRARRCCRSPAATR